MQGPVEETEQDIEKNMLPLQPEKTFGKRSMRRKVHTRAESGTCNVCSAPCSSCMHLKLACMGSKSNEFSDETCHETATSQSSINEDQLSPFKNRAYDSLQHATSEASNFPSVNSCHDSLSENMESKASIRCSDIVDVSAESEMLAKLSSGGTVVVDQPFPKPQSILDQITSSNNNEYPNTVEAHDDNISCVSRSNDASIAVSHHNKNVDRKNLSCSSAVVSSLGSGGTGKAPISPKSELLETPSGDAYAGSSSLEVQSRCLSSTTSDTHLAEKDRKIDSSRVSSQLAEGTGKTPILPEKLLETPSNDAYAGCSSPKGQSSTSNGVHLEEDTKIDSSKFSSRLSEGSGKTLVLPKSEIPETPLNDVDAGSSSLKVQSRCLSATNGLQSEEDTKFDTSNFSRKLYPKVEEGTKKDNGDQLDEGNKCLNQVGQDEKLNGSVELPDMREPALQTVSGDESDESEILEHDVKVCDICGDAGREDLLAICSKCSDGAEHTYCMREMLQKVPEGDWLCEECKLAEETENQRQGSDAEAKRTNKSSAPSSGKRHLETMEVASPSKRQAVEASFGSPKSSSPSRTAALSRDSSVKGLDKGKVKPAHPISFVNHSSFDSPRVQAPKGTLLKSNSFNTFNSKPKVKLVDEVPQNQKCSREGRSPDVKVGTARMISKSMSFRSMNSGRSNATESKVKMLSSKYSQAQDVKALKQAKERNAFESKSSSKLDRPIGSSLTTSSNVCVSKVGQKLTPHGDSVMSSSTSNNKESNTSQSDGKLGSSSRSISSIAHKGAEIPVTSVRPLPANGVCSASVEQKLNQVSAKDEPSLNSSWTAERPYNNVEENVQDGLSRSRESSNQSEKAREISVSRSKPASTAGQKNIACKKCKEIGHVAEFCTVDSPQASGIDTTGARTVWDDMSKGSKLKALLEAAMLKKPGIFRKKKESDQSDGLSSSNVDIASEIASHDQFSVSNKMRNVISDEGTDEGQANFGISSSENCKLTDNNNEKQLNVHSTDAVFRFKAGDLDPTFPSIGKPSHALAAVPIFSKMLTIPEHEYIWQGSFEVRRGGKTLYLYGGIQAHLSVCASPKVLEVVNLFPQKITLDELPRLSTWPRQFHGNGAKEDNIALYFFARDLESYEKSYKNLLDNMIKRDLALKGYFDGVEFLIFPSTQLPENSQCWNMMFFLWGVFRGRRSNCSDSLSKSFVPNSNVMPWDMNSPEDPYASLNGDIDNGVSSLQANSEQQNGRLDSTALSKTTMESAVFCPGTRSTSPSKEVAALPKSRLDTECKQSTEATGSNIDSNSREETKTPVDASCIREVEVSQVGDQAEDVGGSVEEKMVDIMVDSVDTGRNEAKFERNLNEDSMRVDAEASSGTDLNIKGLDCWQSSSRKRAYLELSETVPEISNREGQKLPSDTVDRDNISKKLKPGFCERYGCSSLREGISSSVGFASQICDSGSRSSIEEKCCEQAVDEKVILEDMGTTERYFFPLDSRRVKDSRLGGNSNSMPWKECSSNDEIQLHDGVPNLELALGAESKPPNKGILPFFVGMLEKNNTQNKTPDNVTDKEEEDGVSASLSLSLSFPFPEKEQTVKPVSKTEQLLHKRRHVNTSLLLFGGLSDK
ncbi:uncharacterized protein LOC110622611 isoform X4 [Manihot esculenta]|nr:uncharacterized protein LOC110622611 isoform X4 [Manihot esculenta]XP_021622872.1 uncharacterized protein LOC110622611 isoform X4 [Manihot esculenta]KAG8647945.1 hypothetical protein MANES_09G129500v8 [Manihot esculenta]KAG8647948.1 hypothetical protein MANES_09G129500v8 [Manihot esculenta]OAY41794.1 hypothetical protein MANES_09G129500v8 [Manihot esculenta]